MLHSIKNLRGYAIGATDGEIGKVKDFYVDDRTWKVRYLIVETGNWLFGRKVLLSPVALQDPDWDDQVFPVNLTKDQVKHSPDIDTERPVSREQEEDLYRHYSWPMDPGAGIGFMTTGMVGGVIAPGVPFDERIAEEVRYHEKDTMSDRGPEPEHAHDDAADPDLLSFKDVKGYSIHAMDDVVGEVTDFLVDSAWKIPFLVIKADDWYTGGRLCISTNKITRIDWDKSIVYISQSRDSLTNLPPFDSDQLVNEDYEQRLYEMY